MANQSFIVRFKKDAPDAEKQKVKDEVTKQGGKIGHEYKLIDGKLRTRGL